MAERTAYASEDGFSLLELVVVVGVAAIVMAVLTLGIRQASESFTLQRGASMTVNELRRAQAAAVAAGVDYTVEFYTTTGTDAGGIRVWTDEDADGTYELVRSALSPEWPSRVQMPDGADNFPACPSVINPNHDCAVYKPLGYPVSGGEVILRAGSAGIELTVVVEPASGRVRVER